MLCFILKSVKIALINGIKLAQRHIIIVPFFFIPDFMTIFSTVKRYFHINRLTVLFSLHIMRSSNRLWLGAIAQLGERLHGMQEVSGSIPLSSTKFEFQPNMFKRS